VGKQAMGAILDSVFGAGPVAAAVFSQGIQRTVAEQAVEVFHIPAFVAGEIFAGFILKKPIGIVHIFSLYYFQIDLFKLNLKVTA
jgi:hypothetical protein